MTVTEQDVEILARTIYGEARGEDYEGKILVGSVMIERWRTNHRGKDTLTEVCQDPWQFSCWNEGDPNKWKILNVTLEDKHYRECMMAAIEVIDVATNVPANTRHYFADYIDPPSWAEDDKLVIKHGHHKFYQGIA